jgi:hypothetical protein
VATRLAGARQLVQAVIIAGTSFIVVPFSPAVRRLMVLRRPKQRRYKELAAASSSATPSSRLSSRRPAPKRQAVRYSSRRAIDHASPDALRSGLHLTTWAREYSANLWNMWRADAQLTIAPHGIVHCLDPSRPQHVHLQYASGRLIQPGQ